MRFRTKSGTIYTLDSLRHLFYGGKFKTPVQYVHASAIIGCRAQITLIDGRIVNTSVVERYL